MFPKKDRAIIFAAVYQHNTNSVIRFTALKIWTGIVKFIKQSIIGNKAVASRVRGMLSKFKLTYINSVKK